MAVKDHYEGRRRRLPKPLLKRSEPEEEKKDDTNFNSGHVREHIVNFYSSIPPYTGSAGTGCRLARVLTDLILPGAEEDHRTGNIIHLTKITFSLNIVGLYWGYNRCVFGIDHFGNIDSVLDSGHGHEALSNNINGIEVLYDSPMSNQTGTEPVFWNDSIEFNPPLKITYQNNNTLNNPVFMVLSSDIPYNSNYGNANVSNYVLRGHVIINYVDN